MLHSCSSCGSDDLVVLELDAECTIYECEACGDVLEIYEDEE